MSGGEVGGDGGGEGGGEPTHDGGGEGGGEGGREEVVTGTNPLAISSSETAFSAAFACASGTAANTGLRLICAASGRN